MSGPIFQWPWQLRGQRATTTQLFREAGLNCWSTFGGHGPWTVRCPRVTFFFMEGICTPTAFLYLIIKSLIFLLFFGLNFFYLASFELYTFLNTNAIRFHSIYTFYLFFSIIKKPKFLISFVWVVFSPTQLAHTLTALALSFHSRPANSLVHKPLHARGKRRCLEP